MGVVLAVYVSIHHPLFLFLPLAFAVSSIAFLSLIKDPWRRAYVFAILTLIAGSSGLNAVASVGSAAKIFAIGLLLLVSIRTTSSQSPRFVGSPHRLVLISLWVTAVFAITSIVWSASKLETLFDGTTVVLLVLILHRVSTTRWHSRSTLIGDFVSLYWALIVVLLLSSVLSFSGYAEAVGGGGRHQGIFANPNMLGLVAAISFTIGLGIAVERRRIPLWLSLAVPLVSVLFSESRTALVAVLIGLVWSVARYNTLLLIPMSIGAIIASLGFSVVGVSSLGGTFDRFAQAEEGDLLNSRTQAWQDVIWHIQENPLGAGWAATRVAMEQLYNSGFTSSGIFTMHNSWFQILNELGWPGLIPIGLLIVATVSVAFCADVNGLGFGLVATVLAGSMIHLTESVMLGIGQPYPYIFWAAVLAASVNRNIEPIVESTTFEKSTSSI